MASPCAILGVSSVGCAWAFGEPINISRIAGILSAAADLAVLGSFANSSFEDVIEISSRL
jgi:hypothetical protein